MKKIINFLLTSLYILILMLLSVFMSWEYYAKDHVENYIKENYGNAIIQQSNDLKIIKSFEIFKEDDANTSN